MVQTVSLHVNPYSLNFVPLALNDSGIFKLDILKLVRSILVIEAISLFKGNSGGFFFTIF